LEREGEKPGGVFLAAAPTTNEVLHSVS
jgi:hypothetical protein